MQFKTFKCKQEKVDIVPIEDFYAFDKKEVNPIMKFHMTCQKKLELQNKEMLLVML